MGEQERVLGGLARRQRCEQGLLKGCLNGERAWNACAQSEKGFLMDHCHVVVNYFIIYHRRPLRDRFEDGVTNRALGCCTLGWECFDLTAAAAGIRPIDSSKV